MRPGNIEEPVTQPGGREGETVTTHPAFAQIGAFRMSGGANLYDSDFAHNNHVRIRIVGSELVRNLSYDRHHPDTKPIIEIAMSEAQWATFVSSMNAMESPCTLVVREGVRVPQLPPPKSRVEQFSAEGARDMADALAALKELDAAIEALGLSGKKTDALKGLVRNASSRITTGMPFIADQFVEHMEKTVQKAKAEVHGYMNGALRHAGLEALGAKSPLQIEDQGE